jgi:hypothetical protein
MLKKQQNKNGNGLLFPLIKESMERTTRTQDTVVDATYAKSGEDKNILDLKIPEYVNSRLAARLAADVGATPTLGTIFFKCRCGGIRRTR